MKDTKHEKPRAYQNCCRQEMTTNDPNQIKKDLIKQAGRDRLLKTQNKPPPIQDLNSKVTELVGRALNTVD